MAKSALIVEQGPIASIKLPPGFSEQEEKRREYPDYLRQFSFDEDENVTFAFYYRGHRLSQESAQRFQRMLESGERDLSKEEFQNISSMVRDAADPESFRLISTWVMSLNGIHVLALKGTWIRSLRRSLAVFIDTDGAGSTVQEIHYVAPEEKFDAHYPVIVETLKSITWK